MNYELRTTIGVSLLPGQSLESVRAGLSSTLESVAAEHRSVNAIFVRPAERDLELVVGIRFHDGVRADYVEETATEMLAKAIEQFERTSVHSQPTEIHEESVRLQSVFA